MGIVQVAQGQGAHGLQKIGEEPVGEQRHVRKHVVEHVGLLKVIELGRGAQPGGGRKAAGRQQLKKRAVVHNAGHGHQRPAGGLVQQRIHRGKVGDVGGLEIDARQPFEKPAGGHGGQHLHLALKQGAPHPLVVGGVVGVVLHEGIGGGGRNVVHKKRKQ